MVGEVDEHGWQELRAQVQGEVAAWRRAHPRATPTEIEGATATALQRLQARYCATWWRRARAPTSRPR